MESGGKFAGSLNNYGDVIVRGVFGGTTSSDRSVRLADQRTDWPDIC